MAPQDFASYASSTCAILMVLGSMGLLFKGIVTLKNADPKSALSIELKKQVRLTSHYPALGLFLIGWVFLLVPMLWTTSEDSAKGLPEILVEGSVIILPPHDIDKVVVRILGGPWEVNPDTDGSFSQQIYPSLRRLRLEISAPGRQTVIKTVHVSTEGVINIGPVQMPNPLIDLDSVPSVTNVMVLDSSIGEGN